METARVAYEAYTKLAFQGIGTKWEDLPESVKDIWREVSRDVFRHGWDESRKPPLR